MNMSKEAKKDGVVVMEKAVKDETLTDLVVPPAPEEPSDISVDDNPWRDDRSALLKECKADDKADQWEFMYADPNDSEEMLERKHLMVHKRGGKVVRHNNDPVVKMEKKEWQRRQVRDARLAAERAKSVVGSKWRSFSHKRDPVEPMS
jgi:hypothetical protein